MDSQRSDCSRPTLGLSDPADPSLRLPDSVEATEANVNQPTRGYRTLVAPVCCLAAVAFVGARYPQAPATSQRAVAKVSHLNQIASIHLRAGMTSTEVAECLAPHGLHQVSIGHLGVSATIYYGLEGSHDPVIAVDFRRKARRDYFVTEWRVEK